MSKEAALVLTGGGGKVAFQVGVEEVLRQAGYSWKMLSGVSGGALNSAILSSGDEDQLSNIWLQIEQGDIFGRGWFGTLKRLLMREEGLFSTGPLRSLLSQHLPDEAEVPLRYSAVDINTDPPERTLFTEEDLSIDTVVASASIPGVVPPVKINGKHLIDGGVKDSALVSPVLEEGIEEIVLVDVGDSSVGEIDTGHPIINRLIQGFVAAHDELQAGDVRPVERINDFLDQVEAHNTEISDDCLEFDYMSDEGDEYQHVNVTRISPDDHLGSPLDLTSKSIRSRWMHGREIARRFLKSEHSVGPSDG